jgi:hypothetical protein
MYIDTELEGEKAKAEEERKTLVESKLLTPLKNDGLEITASVYPGIPAAGNPHWLVVKRMI